MSDQDILKLEVARMIREDFLQQNAFQDEDTYTSFKKQSIMLSNIIEFYHQANDYLNRDHVYIADIMNMESVYLISRMKYVSDEALSTIESLPKTIEAEFEKLVEGGEY